MHETFDSRTGYVIGIHRFAWVAKLHARMIGGAVDSAVFGEGHASEWYIDA